MNLQLTGEQPQMDEERAMDQGENGSKGKSAPLRIKDFKKWGPGMQREIMNRAGGFLFRLAKAEKEEPEGLLPDGTLPGYATRENLKPFFKEIRSEYGAELAIE